MEPPAAGLPWFMALFGRDSLITSYQALPFQPHLALATLKALARLQARGWDDYHDAEPGKIPHELRAGELTALGDVPFGPYYGTHDATLLFLIVLDEYERWTGDAALVRRLEPTARAALDWTGTGIWTATATWSTASAPPRAWGTTTGRTRASRCSSPTAAWRSSP